MMSTDCSTPDNTALIRSRLEALVHSTHPAPFLIIQEARSQKFIQFSGQTLQFDLPKQTLTDREFESATNILADHGIEPVTYKAGNFEQTTFQKELKGNVEQATALAEVVLFSVYGFDRDATFDFLTE